MHLILRVVLGVRHLQSQRDPRSQLLGHEWQHQQGLSEESVEFLERVHGLETRDLQLEILQEVVVRGLEHVFLPGIYVVSKTLQLVD